LILARPAGSAPALGKVVIVELFFAVLLSVAALLIVWFAIYVVYRLLHEDR
jgi:hypothetical protein